MRTYKDLEIHGSPEALSAFLRALEARLGHGWERGEGRERDVRGTQGPMYCFTCDRKAVALWLATRCGGGELYVPNVVPVRSASNVTPLLRRGHLSFDAYNAIIDEFRTTFVDPLASELGLKVYASSGEFRIGDRLSGDALDKLREFSENANRPTCGAHPLDRQRWFSFVIAAHQHQSPLLSDELGRWLRESEGWEGDAVQELEIRYENDRELLGYYDDVLRPLG